MARNSRWRRRACVAIAAGAALPALAAPSANAAFTSPKCGGSDTGGAGASFQNLAQSVWRGTQLFKSSAQCGSGGPSISYASLGSGAGRTAIGATSTGLRDGESRAPGSRFGASDFAVTKSQRDQAVAGRPGVTGDEAELHSLPVAVGAITVVVNFPNGCQVPSTSPKYHDADGGTSDADDTARFKTTNVLLEAAFAGTGPDSNTSVDTWGELLDDADGGQNITAIPSTVAGDLACAERPIIRVVREDSSGTTEGFKRWLEFVPGRQSNAPWGTTYLGSSGNQQWPNDGSTTNPPPDTATFKNAQQNEGVASTVADPSNDGAIGYVELAQARNSEFNKQARPPGGAAVNSYQRDGTFWIPIQRGTGDTYVEPTTDPLSYKNSSNTPGANCSEVVFTDRANSSNPEGTLPADTFGIWDRVLGVHSSQGYGVCALTYILAYDDNSQAFNSVNDPKFADQVAEERRARTLKDYLTAIVSDQGQAVLEPRDYSAVPASVLAKVRAGVASIDWNKAGNSTGGGGNTGGDAGGGTTGGGVPPTPTAPIASGPPSNAFTIPSSRSAKNGVITIKVNLPGAGQVKSQATTLLLARFTGTRKNKRITYGRATIQANGAGPATITIKPSAAAKKALKKGAKLKVSVRLTFTPNGGTANSQTKTVTVKGQKAKRRS